MSDARPSAADEPCFDNHKMSDGGVEIKFHRHDHPNGGVGYEVITYGRPEPTRDEVIDALHRVLRLYGAEVP